MSNHLVLMHRGVSHQCLLISFVIEYFAIWVQILLMYTHDCIDQICITWLFCYISSFQRNVYFIVFSSLSIDLYELLLISLSCLQFDTTNYRIGNSTCMVFQNIFALNLLEINWEIIGNFTLYQDNHAAVKRCRRA